MTLNQLKNKKIECEIVKGFTKILLTPLTMLELKGLWAPVPTITPLSVLLFTFLGISRCPLLLFRDVKLF